MKFKVYLYLEKLPYCLNVSVKLSQTFAILKYLGRKHNTKANNEKEQAVS